MTETVQMINVPNEEFVARGRVEAEKVELLREVRRDLAGMQAQATGVQLVTREPCKCGSAFAPQKGVPELVVLLALIGWVVVGSVFFWLVAMVLHG